MESKRKKLKTLQYDLAEYTKEWPFLINSQKSVNHVFCTICSCDFLIQHDGDDCRRHVESKKHLDNAAVKAPRKQSALGGKSASTPKSGKSDRHSGGNHYYPRPTPSWQKPITSFFSKADEKDKCAETKSKQDACATNSYVNFYQSMPGCSKDDPFLMEYMDSEAMSNNEDSRQDDSAVNPKLEENAMNLNPVASSGDCKLEGDANKMDAISSEEDAMNLEPVPIEGIKFEEDVKNSELVSNEEELKLNEGVKNVEIVSKENGEEDSEAIAYEVDYQDDDSSDLCESCGINAATIGVHASPTVNDLDDQDSGCVDE